jgi:hypothetical protein
VVVHLQLDEAKNAGVVFAVAKSKWLHEPGETISQHSKLRRDSVGAGFQSVRKLTNYVCAKPLESRLSAFRKGS